MMQLNIHIPPDMKEKLLTIKNEYNVKNNANLTLSTLVRQMIAKAIEGDKA